jgi:hypothetical protein
MLKSFFGFKIFFLTSITLFMKSPNHKSWLIALPVLIFNTSEIFPGRPYTIEGAITNSTTGKNIENAYVYIVSGEEEALTNAKGVFTISTWQQLPVTLIVEHPTFKQKKIRVADASQYQLIKLDPKQ